MNASLMDRRRFLNMAAGTVALMTGAPTLALVRPRIKALAFDAFPVFDPRPIFARAGNLFPDRGAELANAWRVRQFEYQWWRALSGQYADFWRATEDALVFAARMLKLDLTPEKREQLMSAYLELRAWPDAAPALRALKERGIRLAFLSNATPRILQAGIENSGLQGLFEHVLSTDLRRTYKPATHAYQMGVDAFGLEREEIGFVAFAGWDVAGAKWFGYPTFWVNRANQPAEEVGVAPDGVGSNLDDLVRFVSSRRA